MRQSRKSSLSNATKALQRRSTHLVGGVGNRRVLQDGEMDAGAWSCGMVVGLIRDIPTCKELIGRIMAEAAAIIRSRLEGVLAA
jgi:NAD(P)H-dependent flavin oxidoreductase YrpB (nitropropane dioxygenase family)